MILFCKFFFVFFFNVFEKKFLIKYTQPKKKVKLKNYMFHVFIISF